MAVLHTEFTKQVIEESKASETDKKIYAYIEKHGDIVYDTVISQEKEWQIFYQLSELV